MTLSTSNDVLQSMRLSDHAFRPSITTASIPTDGILALLRGQIATLVVNESVPDIDCAEITRRFWASRGTVPRGDGVPGHSLGAFHYGKTFERYQADVRATSGLVEDLFEGITSPVEVVLDAVRKAASELNAQVRPASWRGNRAASARALAWEAEGKFMLAPHDDIGQLSQRQQADFEIQRVAAGRVIAVNIYPSVPVGGGNLRFWNLVPDESLRNSLGIAETGYPYPESMLQTLPTFDVEVQTGAVVMANGGLVHAVTGYPGAAEHRDRRLIINFFFGLMDDSTIIYWV